MVGLKIILTRYSVIKKQLPQLEPVTKPNGGQGATALFIIEKEKVKFIPITFRPRQGGVNSINMKKIFKIGV